MASSFPSSIDSFPDPLANSPLNAPSHSALHQDVNDAVEKIEVKLGVGASDADDASVNQVLMADGAGGSAWESVTNSKIDTVGVPAQRVLASDGAGGAVWSSFRILQVVTTTDTTARSTTANYPVTSGISLTITPLSSSSLIFLVASVTFGVSGGSNANKIVLAGLSFGAGSTTPLYSTRVSASSITDWFINSSMTFLHTPATTSPCVYNILYGRYSASFDNNCLLNTGALATGNGSTTLTAFEIAP